MTNRAETTKRTTKRDTGESGSEGKYAIVPTKTYRCPATPVGGSVTSMTRSIPTTDGLVEASVDYAIDTQGGEESLEEVLAPTDNQTYDSADDVRSRTLGLVHR
ncbi:DUF5789 family protein [Halorarum salinum]|uniref:DUF5789 family protein n=1 Tax=Halorarum salinum TaxID=2743089 RepID=UPI001FE4A59A|nr:hypothetical protein [Halobaculum salinum]